MDFGLREIPRGFMINMAQVGLEISSSETFSTDEEGVWDQRCRRGRSRRGICEGWNWTHWTFDGDFLGIVVWGDNLVFCDVNGVVIGFGTDRGLIWGFSQRFFLQSTLLSVESFLLGFLAGVAELDDWWQVFCGIEMALQIFQLIHLAVNERILLQLFFSSSWDIKLLIASWTLEGTWMMMIDEEGMVINRERIESVKEKEGDLGWGGVLWRRKKRPREIQGGKERMIRKWWELEGRALYLVDERKKKVESEGHTLKRNEKKRKEKKRK
jgi:hypothetical protein